MPSSPSPPEPDQAATAAWSALRAGDPDAIDAFCRREHPLIFRLCAGFLADANEAEDVAQDALLRLLDRLPQWEAEQAWAPWRNTVVLNLCRDRLRRRATRRAAEDAGARHAQPGALPAPDDAAAASEVRAVLLDALSELSPREREVFVLRDLEGAETTAVAVSLGIGESSVRSLLTLARRRLRGVLEQRAPGLCPAPLAGTAGRGGSDD